MKIAYPKSVVIVILLACCALQAYFTDNDKPEMYDNAVAEVHQYWKNTSDSFAASMKQLESAVKQGTGKDQYREQYHQCRRHYKHMEFLVEYFLPTTARQLNGPLIMEADEEEGTQNVFEPEGLQVLEAFLYDAYDSMAFKRELHRTVLVAQRQAYLASIQRMLPWQVFDAIRQQVIRNMALNITGFDSPFSGNAITETAYTLESLQQATAAFTPSLRVKKRSLVSKLNRSLAQDKEYLLKHTDFDTFDRYTYIRQYANPLFGLITDTRDALEIIPLDIPSAVRISARSIFEQGVFDPEFYGPHDAYPGSQRVYREQLGQLLFFDPILSGNQQRSCASCHQPGKAFTDGLDRSIAFGGDEKVERNAPTILNAALQAAYFQDASVIYLEQQVTTVTNNANELHGNFDRAVALMRGSEEYRQLFGQAFAGSADSAITPAAIRKAIAAYERSLIRMNSRFDRDMRGGKKLLTAEEQRGFNLFMGKAVCGTCHFLPLFNGTVPPQYQRTEWEIIGVPAQAAAPYTLDPDPGRKRINAMQLHNHAFKTSTVRNATLTAPYMHNGVYRTLNEVVDFYNKGGGAGLGLDVPNQTLPFDSLGLTIAEQQDIVAFMHTLTDTTHTQRIPQRLPAVEQVSRKVGGSY